MRKIIMGLVVLLAMVSAASAADVTLAWDHDGFGDADPAAVGFELFAVPVNSEWDFAIPIATVAGDTHSVTVDIQGNMELRFVCRAFLRGTDTTYYSGLTNTVQHAVVSLPSSLRLE